MKRLLLLAIAAAGVSFAQDCAFTGSFSSATPGAAQSNKSTTTGGNPCTFWVVTYWTTGASGVSVKFEGAADVAGASSGSYTALTATTGVNPMTATNEGSAILCCDYYPWLRINPTTFTGTNQHMTFRAYGWYSPLGSGSGGGGSGTVTTVGTGCGLSGGPISVSGTVITSFTVNPQTGSSPYAIADGDCGKLISRNQASAVLDTIAQAGSGGLRISGWWTVYECRGAGGCTITPATSTIDGASSLVLTQNQGVMIFSDGSNYFTFRGVGSSGGSGSVTSITIAGTANQIAVAGTCTVTTSGTCTLSLPSNLILPSGTTGTTQSPGDNSTKIATTAYADAAAAAAPTTPVFTGSTASAPSFSATPTFSLAAVSSKSPLRVQMTITANVTAVTFSNKSAGAKFSIAWTQDGSGSHTVTYGASASNTCAVSPTASITTTQFLEVAADGSTVVGTGCITNESGIDRLTTVAAPATPASGLACWGDSTDTDYECKDSAGIVYKMLRSGVDVNPVTGQVTNGSHITNSSVPNSGLVNPSMTVGGASCTLGGSCSPASAGGSLSYLGNTGAVTLDGTDLDIFSSASISSPGAGKCISAAFAYQKTGGIGTVTYKVWLGTTAATIWTATGNAGIWEIAVRICNNAGVQNAQVFNFLPISLGLGGAWSTFSVDNNDANMTQSGAGIDWTSSQTIKLTANGANTEAVTGYWWELR